MRYDPSNTPKGTIYYKGYFEKAERIVTPAEALSIMESHSQNNGWSEYDRMIRYALKGLEFEFLYGGDKFKFVPN